MSINRVSIIVAMADNRVIGDRNRLLWHIPEDLKRFKALTIGKPVIMGRKTYESILDQLGKPLPGRTNIVISRGGYSHDGAKVVASLDDALTVAAQGGGDEIFIIGGAQIYEQAMDRANRLYLTQVHREYEGDAVFPSINLAQWQAITSERHEGDPAFTFVVMERI